MPPKTRIEREVIIDEAFSITKEKGFEGLNARNLAQRLNCSVQPIFHKFKNMEDLKHTVMNKIIDTYRSYMSTTYNKDYTIYKNMGIGYITFAKNEPKLFQILFMNNINKNVEDFIGLDEFYGEIEKTIKSETGLDSEDTKKLHSRVWVFTHGLATLIATNTCKFSDEEISEMLSDIYIGLRLRKTKEEGNLKDEKDYRS